MRDMNYISNLPSHSTFLDSIIEIGQIYKLSDFELIAIAIYSQGQTHSIIASLQ
jgi:hypothetical protein